MTVRLAIGAGRGRLVKQLFTEGLILAAFGAAADCSWRIGAVHALVLLFPARGGVAMHLPGEIDWRVLAVSGGVCVIATLLLGLVPAMQTGKIDLAGALKSDAGGVVGGGGRAWVRSGLVVVQVSLSFVLLVGAGLLLTELAENSKYQPGFFDARCAGHGREFGGGRIRCAARPDFPERTTGAREGAAGRGVGSVRANDAAELWNLFFDGDCRGWVSTAARGAAPPWSTTKWGRAIS